MKPNTISTPDATGMMGLEKACSKDKIAIII